jgi:hypothetical protein
MVVSTPSQISTYPPCVVPSDLDDPAFARHVDLLLLGTAWDNHDAALITDIGLQLAGGERILMRPHKELKSDSLLEFATHVAGDRKDNVTLLRMKKVAEARKDQRLEALVARCTAQAETVDDHPMGNAIEDMSSASLDMHKSAIRKIRSARLAGKGSELDYLDKYFDQQRILHKSQKEHIDKELAKARGNLQKESDFRGLIGISDRLASLTPCRN